MVDCQKILKQAGVYDADKQVVKRLFEAWSLVNQDDKVSKCVDNLDKKKRRHKKLSLNFILDDPVPEHKRKIREYKKRQRAKPENKQKMKEYNSRPEVKQKMKEYQSRPENKQKMKLKREELKKK